MRDGGIDGQLGDIAPDPVGIVALILGSQINLQLRQINMNAAGGRAEIAGSEQSVRVVGSALSAHQLGETQIALGGGRFGSATWLSASFPPATLVESLTGQPWRQHVGLAVKLDVLVMITVAAFISAIVLGAF